MHQFVSQQHKKPTRALFEKKKIRVFSHVRTVRNPAQAKNGKFSQTRSLLCAQQIEVIFFRIQQKAALKTPGRS
jgi:hypothetical protein